MKRTEQLTIHRSSPPVVHARYEKGGTRTIAEEVIDALAEAEGVDASDLPCIYETIDLDALTQLFERQDRKDSPDTVLSFTFDKWNVFVRGDGRICVCDGTRSTEPTPVFAD